MKQLKRLAFSLFAGFAIPFLYTSIIGPLSLYITNRSMNELAEYPVRWPILVLYRLVPLDSFPFRDKDSLALLIYIVGADVILYAIVTYILLWGLAKRKSKPPDPPPGPPIFVQ